MTESEFAFVAVAGGRGRRMSQDVPKQFLNLGNRPVWLWSVLTAARLVNEIVVVAPADFVQEMKSVCEAEKALSGLGVKVVPGGKERADSVRNGLFSCSSDFVMIHDAARPFLSEQLCRRLIDAVDENTGVIPLVPVADALKRVEGESIEPVDRDGLFGAQTPQCFPRLALIDALNASALAGIIPKDEAESWGARSILSKQVRESEHLLKERACTHCRSLKYVDGERLNFKITFPEDFIIAEALVKCREAE